MKEITFTEQERDIILYCINTFSEVLEYEDDEDNYSQMDCNELVELLEGTLTPVLTDNQQGLIYLSVKDTEWEYAEGYVETEEEYDEKLFNNILLKV